jgi:hypothetical protein
MSPSKKVNAAVLFEHLQDPEVSEYSAVWLQCSLTFRGRDSTDRNGNTQNDARN